MSRSDTSRSDSGPRPAARRRLPERARLAARLGWLGLRGLALGLGSAVLLALLAFLIWPSWVAMGVADRILANALIPAGTEMPPTTAAITYSSADVQVLGGRGEGLGCSLPAPVEPLFPRVKTNAGVNLQMRQACAAHDYCYRHGSATYGYTQADCDFLLQEQAFRICPFIEEDKKPNPDDCRARARLVTLGVRTGGSDSFRRAGAHPKPPSGVWTERDGFDAAASTYFEFDPYPVRSPRYVVYRLADAPGTSAPPRRKALYTFDVRPSGTVVTVTSWTDGAGRIGDVHRINAQHAFLNTPPMVLRSGSGEDWFVWWQRLDLSGTGGRFVALAPARADKEDWNLLEQTPPPARSPEDCVGASRTDAARRSAVAVIYVGKRAEHCDEANASEFQPAPGLAPPGDAVRLMNLRTHTCERSSTNILCFTDIVLDLSGGGGHQPQEPNRANDAFNRRPDDSAGRDSDRYRNFVTAPVALGGEGGPILAFFRRGGADGKGFDDELFVRRQRVENRGTPDETGGSIGSAALEGLAEDDEPFFVLGRNTGAPALATLRLDPPLDRSLFTRDEDRSGALRFRRWVLPAADRDKAFAKPIAVRSASSGCDALPHASWLSRPASVVAQPDGGALVVLSRMTAPESAAAAGTALLEVQLLRLSPSGTCSVPPGTTIRPVPVGAPAVSEERADLDEARRAKLRAVPVLADDMDGDGTLDLVVPNADDPALGVLRTSVISMTQN